MVAGLDAKGDIESLHMRIAGQSILAGLAPQNVKNGLDVVVFQGLNTSGAEAAIGYTFPHLLIGNAMRNPSTPVGFWGGVGEPTSGVAAQEWLELKAFLMSRADGMPIEIPAVRPKVHNGVRLPFYRS